MTRPDYLSRPLGPGTPGVSWDARRVFAFTRDGLFLRWCVEFECGRGEGVPFFTGRDTSAEFVCDAADRLARRMVRR